MDPETYERWYRTARGRWIGDHEFNLLRRLMRPAPATSLLDVGCGTGYFSRRFAAAEWMVAGIDQDVSALRFARRQAGGIDYVQGDAARLPFPNQSFDYCIAVTSLCFIAEPLPALREMLRVSRLGVTLGLLNRHSLLYYRKQGRGGYRDARWDSVKTVRQWRAAVERPLQLQWRSAIFLPGGGPVARIVERLTPNRCGFGGFLAVKLTPDSGLTTHNSRLGTCDPGL